MKPTLNFKYTSTFSYWIFFPVLIFGGLTYYSFYLKSAIRYKYIRKLDYPNNLYLFGAIAIAFLLYGFYKLIAYKNTNKDNYISITGNMLSFKPKKNRINVDISTIEELWIKDETDDGEAVIIYTKNNKDRYEFFQDYFESIALYVSFKSAIEQIHVNNKVKK